MPVINPVALAEATAPVLTADMFKPLTDFVSTNVPVVMIVGIGVFATIAGIGLVPKILRKFI